MLTETNKTVSAAHESRTTVQPYEQDGMRKQMPLVTGNCTLYLQFSRSIAHTVS